MCLTAVQILSVNGDIASKFARAQYLTLWNVVLSLSNNNTNAKGVYSFKVPSDASLGDSFEDEPEKLEDVSDPR